MNKSYTILVFILTLFLSLLTTQLSEAQNFNPADLRNVNVNELSDDQIRQAKREIESRGLTLQQFEQLAIAQGASRAQVSQLVSRIRQIRGGEHDGSDTLQTDQLSENVRQVEPMGDEEFQELHQQTEVEQDSLQIFGMDLFDRVSVNFEPSFNVPTPKDYTVGAGDQLVIDIWGAAEQTYQLRVSAEGNIRIPNLGPIYVNGLQIDDAEQRILNRLTDIYSGLRPNDPGEGNTFAQVSLGNVRSIKVTVLGEVKQPGTYSISSLSTAFNALYASGGPTKQGTFRNIEIIRDREIVERLDMYDFLVSGNQESNIRLRDQDVIKVNPYENRIHVWGETKRKGFFETRPGETLEDVLTFAAGFTEEAYTARITLEGVTPTMRRVTSVAYPEEADRELFNGDKVRVGKIIDRYTNRIELVGAVYRPGTYEYSDGLMLSELIEKADGVKEEAFMERGVIERLNDRREPIALNFSVERVVNEPERFDIELRPDDIIRISSIFDLREEFTISVDGAVNSDTTFQYREGLTLEDAIFIANGFRDDAAEYRVDVSRRITGGERNIRGNLSAENFRFEVGENLEFRDDADEFELKAFDRIFVRMKPNYQTQQTLTIEGEVQFPGTYVLSTRDMRLSDLIEMAGGLSNYAFPRGASLERELDELEDIDEELFFLNNNEIAGNLEDSDRGNKSTSVGIRLERAIQEPGSKFDLILFENDVIRIPKELQTVRIEGEVLNPTSVRYDPGRSFSSYLDAAGGITDSAMRSRAYIVYANGEVDRSKRFLFFRNNPDVEPGATIIIPREPERREMSPQERVALLSTIASTMATVALIYDRLAN